MSRAEDLDAALHRLAGLLSDTKGTEILAELQKAAVLSRPPGRGLARVHQDPGAVGHVGRWHLVEGPTGVALTADGVVPADAGWAAVDHIPAPNGARRVVLLGESSARGHLLEPGYTPAVALQQTLDTAQPDAYQVVDLACTGADLRTLAAVVEALPAVGANVIVLYAGNNWMLPVYTAAQLITLSRALERGGRKQLRTAFWSEVVRPGVMRFLDRLAEIAGICDSDVIVVVPEYNLLGWHPAEATGVPRLDAGNLDAWLTLLERGRAALEEGRWSAAGAAATEAISMDGGASPASLHLAGMAAMESGEPGQARRFLELARDVSHGTLLANTPGATTEIQQALTDYCESRGFACVDLRIALADGRKASLPDPAYFLDYCHLSAEGIDRMVTEIDRKVHGVSGGMDVAPKGATAGEQAMSHLLAACHAAHCDQPPAAVGRRLDIAVHCDASITTVMHMVLDLLEGAGPVWAQPTIGPLRTSAQAARYFDTMLTRDVGELGLWVLRQELGRVLGRVAAEGPTDLISGIRAGGVRTVLRPPNHTPPRAYHQATTRHTRIGFARPAGAGSRLELTGRTPAAAPAVIRINGLTVGLLTFGRRWTSHLLRVPPELVTKDVNWLEIEWPVPALDTAAGLEEDASALARGGYPFGLPVFADLFTVRWHDTGATP